MQHQRTNQPRNEQAIAAHRQSWLWNNTTLLATVCLVRKFRLSPISPSLIGTRKSQAKEQRNERKRWLVEDVTAQSSGCFGTLAVNSGEVRSGSTNQLSC
jgi:hypothetical protein